MGTRRKFTREFKEEVGLSPRVRQPQSSDPERVTFEGATMEVLIQNAYGVMPDQVSGPDWLRNEWYSITAKLPPETTLEQFREMMANLLAERFGLVVHHAARVVSGYELATLPSGPKLGTDVEKTEQRVTFSCRRGNDGLSHCSFKHTSMPTLANRLGMVLMTGPSRDEAVEILWG